VMIGHLLLARGTWDAAASFSHIWKCLNITLIVFLKYPNKCLYIIKGELEI